jgi:hypothetical protein
MSSQSKPPGATAAKRVRVRPDGIKIVQGAVPDEVYRAYKAWAAQNAPNTPTALTRLLAKALKLKGYDNFYMKTY